MTTLDFDVPSLQAPVSEWREYLVHLNGMDRDDVAVRIAVKSAKDIIAMKEQLARLMSRPARSDDVSRRA